jgi:hypothetical protein
VESCTFDSGIILVHKVTLDELNGEGRLSDTWCVVWWLSRGYPRVRKKRMTYHHHQRPQAYILLKTEPRDEKQKYDKELPWTG